MLALRKIERTAGALSLDQIDVADPGPGEVRVQVERTGLCGTDLHIYNWAPFAHRMALPTVIGHEIAGTIDAVGPGVTRVSPGDRVTVESHVWCGHCYACNMGREHLCHETRYPGVDFDGGFAPYAVLPEIIVWKLHADISFEMAALFEPFGVAVHAALEGTGVSGMNILVAGCGPIGQLTIAAARALGAHAIIATDVIPRRLEQALKLGADAAINVADDDALSTILDMTGGNGVDVAFECSGNNAALGSIAPATVMGGEVRLIGVPTGETKIDIAPFFARAINIRVIHGRRLFETWEHATRLVRDARIDLTPIISHTIPLKESEKAFKLALAGEADKILIDPT